MMLALRTVQIYRVFLYNPFQRMQLYGKHGRVLIADIEEILLLNVIGLLLRTEDGCYEHKPLVKSRGRYKPINSAKIMLIKGPVPTPYTIVQHSFRVKFRMRRMVSSLRISLVFPHDYICTSLIVRKSYQLQCPSYFDNRNTSFVIKFEPFAELTDILCVQCETSSGYWHKHKLKGAVYSPNLGQENPSHEPSIPLPSRN